MSERFRIVLATLLVVTGVLVALPSGYVSAAGNVVNGGFEEGTGTVPDGWTTVGNATRVDTGPVYQGSWAAQIAENGGALGQWVYVGNASVGLPVTYNLWGWIYASGNVTGQIAVDFWDADGTNQVSPTEFLSANDTNGSYVEVTAQVSAPVGAIWAKIRLLGTGWEQGGLARFDEIGFYAVTGYCFIATAAYGTETASQLNILREFRDQVLLKSALGSAFVATYYRLSPPVANFIAGSDFLRAAVRALLIDPMVNVLQWSQGLWGP